MLLNSKIELNVIPYLADLTSTTGIFKQFVKFPENG